jgi:hypothetical protein
VHAADFDGNGTLDPVLSYFMGGLSVPVATRDALAVQVPMMRRRFPKYSDYANASLEQVLTPAEKQNAYQVKSEYHPSSYLENKGERPVCGPAFTSRGSVCPRVRTAYR